MCLKVWNSLGHQHQYFSWMWFPNAAPRWDLMNQDGGGTFHRLCILIRLLGGCEAHLSLTTSDFWQQWFPWLSSGLNHSWEKGKGIRVAWGGQTSLTSYIGEGLEMVGLMLHSWLRRWPFPSRRVMSLQIRPLQTEREYLPVKGIKMPESQLP